jgi:nucleolar protein 56
MLNRTAAHALENMMNVTEAVVHEHLSSFLELNLPKSGNAVLGVSDRNFAGTLFLMSSYSFNIGAIKAEIGCECVSDEFVSEVTRALRAHSEKMLKGFKEGGLCSYHFNLFKISVVPSSVLVMPTLVQRSSST